MDIGVQYKARDSKANAVIGTMTTAAVGVGFAPVFIDVGALMLAMGSGVVGIAACYDIKFSKKEAGDLIKQFFKAAGLTFSFVFAGQKITASFLKSNPITYLPTMIADATICGATSFAIGTTSKEYFRKKAMGSTLSTAEIRKFMKEGKKAGKKVAAAEAESKAN